MPTFEFQCRDCGEKFEVLIGVGRADEPRCPACGGVNISRLMTAFRLGARSNGGGGSSCAGCSSTSCSSCKSS